MTKTICDKCNDFGWVCENHPDQEAFECKYCKGAGMPCKCHQLNYAWRVEMKLKDYLATLLLAITWGIWLGYLIWGYK